MMYLHESMEMRMKLQGYQLKELHNKKLVGKILDCGFAVGGMLLGVVSFVYLIGKCVN